MLLEYPVFYPDFACIGKACKDSCCRDWIIDIDEDTAKKYQSLSGDLGEKLRKKLKEKDGAFYFLVEEDGSCPFSGRTGFVKFRGRGERRSFPRSVMPTQEGNIPFPPTRSWIFIYPVKRRQKRF